MESILVIPRTIITKLHLPHLVIHIQVAAQEGMVVATLEDMAAAAAADMAADMPVVAINHTALLDIVKIPS